MRRLFGTMVLGGALLAASAPEALAHEGRECGDRSCRIGGHYETRTIQVMGEGRWVEEAQVITIPGRWEEYDREECVPGHYETRIEMVTIPGRYETVSKQVWCPRARRFITVCEQVWIPPRCEPQTVQVWVPATTRIVRDRRWVPPCTRTEYVRVWKPGCLEMRTIHVWVPARRDRDYCYDAPSIRFKIGGGKHAVRVNLPLGR